MTWDPLESQGHVRRECIRILVRKKVHDPMTLAEAFIAEILNLNDKKI